MDFIFDPSLVLYLPLYGLGGAKIVSCDAYGHLCTVTGAVWRPNGTYFDGTDDNINCGNASSLDITSAITIEYWVYPDAINKFQTVCWKNAAYGSKLTDTNKFRTTVYIGAAAKQAFTPAITGAKTWYHVTFTYDGNDIRPYLNSVLGTAVAQTGSIGTDSSDLYLCRYTAAVKSPIDGLVGEFRLYSRALTPQEIQHNYLATKWRYQ